MGANLPDSLLTLDVLPPRARIEVTANVETGSDLIVFEIRAIKERRFFPTKKGPWQTFFAPLDGLPLEVSWSNLWRT